MTVALAGLAGRAKALERAGLGVGPSGAPAATRAGEVPLSFAQERVWFLDQLEPGTPTYNVPVAFRLSGPLDVPGLERALAEVLRRHEALRTTFSMLDGDHPVQVVAPPQPWALPVEDLSGCDAARRESEVQRLVTEEARRPFDLALGPLVRGRLFRLAGDEHVLVLCLHHIATDGWSMGVFSREVGELYRAFAAGQPSPLPELPLQYADFALWQRGWLQGDALARQLAYWEEQLAGLPSPLDLPTDRPRPVMQTYAGRRLRFVVPQDLSRAIRGLCEDEGVTPFMVLLAVYQVLLHRYTGEDDICVGTPIANRRWAEVERLIGFFVNTLVMRGQMRGEVSFRELLGQVREAALGAFAHQDLPFELLVEKLQPERDTSGSPLFRVMFALQNAPTSGWGLEGLGLERLPVDTGTSKVDLTLFVEESGGELRGTWEYNTDLFDSATIERMTGHFLTLLGSIVADPDEQIGLLPLLTDAERHQLLVEWNDTKTDYPRDTCLHQLFEAQVRDRPHAVAAVYGQERLTYGELNRRANQLAHRLQAMGVGPDVLVGIYMPRCLEFIVAVVGIIKAGGAYLPIDTEYPRDRITFMLKDGDVPVLLTKAHLVESIPAHDAEIICLDPGSPDMTMAIDLGSRGDPGNEATPDSLAYVMYTSGSTGLPKGVAIPQRGIVRLLCGTDYIQLGPSDRIAQTSTTSFDASTFEIWGALLHGGQLIEVPKEVLLSPVDFAAVLREERISVLFVTTALFNHTVAAIPDAFVTLDVVAFGGEAVDPRWVREGLEHGSPRLLLHVYGPTEGTTFTTWYPVHYVAPDARTIPIGRPISNTHVYVLDDHLQAVPVGVRGQLCIGGDGLARGYLNRPEITAARFVPNPFDAEPSARLYLTGDVVRYLPNGELEFLGRRDAQVKIRGFRIELGEIEAVLGQHQGVREAVVTVRGNSSEEKRIMAYVVPSPGQTIAEGDLRRFLEGQLPKFMVPSRFVLLDALPLTANGKVDRRALPDPLRRDLGRASAVPRDELERELADTWASVLSVSHVGIRDGFFDLGGHSLLAVCLFAQIEERLGIRLPVSVLFQAPTIEKLAFAIREAPVEPDRSLVVPIQPSGSKPPFFGIHGISGGVLDHAELARSLGADQPYFGIKAQEWDEREVQHIRMEDLAATYVDAMRSVQPHGPYALGGFCLGGIIAYEMARQLLALGERVALLALIEAYADARSEPVGLLRHGRAMARLLANQPYRLYDRWRRPQAFGVRWARLLNILGLGRPRFTSALDAAYRADVYRVRVRLPLLRALDDYRLPFYPGRLTLFRVRGVPPGYWRDPTLGWGHLAAGGAEVIEIAGAHRDFYKIPHVAVLAAHLKSALAGAHQHALDR